MKHLFWSILALSLATLASAQSPSVKEPYSLYQEAVQKIKEETIVPFNEKKLLDSCLDGMVKSVDKNGRYLNEEEYETLYLSSKPVAGIGLFLTQKRHRIYVKSVVNDSPAEKAMIQKGDEIVQIDATLVRDLDFDEAVAMLRGSPNTKLKLTIVKANQPQPIELQVMRKMLAMDTLSSFMFQGNIAYVKLMTFNQETVSKFLDEVASLYENQNHKMDGMIVDLRDNPGGVINSGIAFSGLFLENEALLITVKSRHKEEKKLYKNLPEVYEGADMNAKKEALTFLRKVPLVILVNNDSAGSSEIVASVLQEYHRATIVGTPTFGKDTFSTLFPLSTTPSALKFATARWSTPKEKSVWPNGVIPDKEVAYEHAENDSALHEALRVLQKQ